MYRTLATVLPELALVYLLLASISYSWPLSSSSVHKFKGAIKIVRDDVLGVTEFQNHVNSVVKLERVSVDGARFSSEVARSLSLKFKDRLDAVASLRQSVAESFSPPSNFGVWENCCSIANKFSNKDYDARFHALVDLANSCNINAPTATFTHKAPSLNFMNVAIRNVEAHPGLKWQFFGSDTGVFTRYPAAPISRCNTTYDNRFRPWYVQASTPKPKDVIVIVDRSGSMKDYGKMEAAKEAAVTVLSTLTPDDRVSVIAFSNEAYALGSKRSEEAVSTTYFVDGNFVETEETRCFQTGMAAATPKNVRRLTKIVNTMVPFGETFYGKALTIAFKFLHGAYVRDIYNTQDQTEGRVESVTSARDRVILFLSDGAPTDAPGSVFKLIQQSNRQMRNSVVLMCYALGNGTFGSALMRMASQDFKMRNSPTPRQLSGNCGEQCAIPKPNPGLYRHVTDTSHLRSAMGSYYTFFSTHKRQDAATNVGSNVVWSVPYFDASGLGMVVTAASSVLIDGELVGVVGADLTMQELFADIAYFRVAGHTAYVFIIDLTGRVLMHPYMPAPGSVDEDPVVTNIDAFERNDKVRRFLQRTLASIKLKLGNNGSGTDDVYTSLFQSLRVLPAGHHTVNTYNASSSYSCSSIRWTPFVTCVVVNTDIPFYTSLSQSTVPPVSSMEFIYHRVELSQHGKLCLHQTQAAVEDKSAVMFAPSAFQDSGWYSEMPETLDMVKEYAAYMLYGNNTSGDVFEPDVRTSFLVSGALDGIWRSLLSKNDTLDGLADFRNHAIWRYLGTEQGVFRIFPGAEMPKLYNPVHRPWYKLGEALTADHQATGLQKNSNSDDVLAAVSPPYIDAHGDGLVVTFSRAITEPPVLEAEASSNATAPSNIFGVMGADIFLSYFERLLKATVTECNHGSSACIVIDLSGYVIYDRRLASNEESAHKLASVSMYHVIHAHPSVARALIDEKILVGRVCFDVAVVAYKFDYTVDWRRVKQRASYLQFAIAYVEGSNVVLLSVPISYITMHGCMPHNQMEACQNSVTGEATCESPCLDYVSASKHFQSCLNLYSRTSTSDPPPCLPPQYRNDSSELTKLELRMVLDERAFGLQPGGMSSPNLPPCSGEVPLGDRPLKRRSPADPDNQQEARKKFIVYVVCVVLLLILVQCGLKRKRISAFIRSRWFSANNTG